MAKFQPWLKMWVEWTDDPKMLSLSLAEQGAWWRLVTLAKKCSAGGSLVKGRGAPLSLNEIAATMRFMTKPDRKVLDSMVEKMVDLGSLHWNSDTLVVTHFADRQAKTTSETPEAVRERVRKYRERKSNPPQTPPIDREREERRGEVTPLHSVTSNGNSVTSEPALAKIASLHEQDFGLITPVLAEKFKDFVQNYHGPVDWIDLAFAVAVQLKKRRWAYVEAILYSWQEKGGPHADRRESAEGQRPGADQRDPIDTWKAAGWDVLGDEPETTEAGDQD